MEKLADMATNIFGDLSAAEKVLIDNAENEPGPAIVPLGAPDIRAGMISWLCTESDVRSRIFRKGIALQGATITGELSLMYADITFPLLFQECIFTSMIYIKNSRLRVLGFRSCSLQGLNADSCVVDNSVQMSDGFKTVAPITFRETVINGSLRADGASFMAAGSQVLVCDRIRVSGGVFLSQDSAPSTFEGEVRFCGADVGGNFDCSSATFSNPLGRALSLDRLTTGGSIFLRNTKASGEIIVGHAKIGANLDCRGAVFESDSERTFNAESANVGAAVLLDGGFKCNKVHFLSIEVDGTVRCRWAKITSLDLRHAHIARRFEWADIEDAAASKLDLRDATVGSLKDDETSWPSSGGLLLDGFRYERFTESVTGLKKRLEWLELDTSAPPQAYRHLSYVYEQRGEFDNARGVSYRFEKLSRRLHSGLWSGIWSFLLRVTVGYGYKLWRAAVIVFILMLLGFGAGEVGYRTKLIAPTDKDANAFFIATGRSPAYYPRFSASMFSIEHSIPALNLGVSSTWSPDTTAQWPGHSRMEGLIRSWFWAQTLLGWVLSIFFVAGLAGIAKTAR